MVAKIIAEKFFLSPINEGCGGSGEVKRIEPAKTLLYEKSIGKTPMRYSKKKTYSPTYSRNLKGLASFG
jgi:hypothetical protein